MSRHRCHYERKIKKNGHLSKPAARKTATGLAKNNAAGTPGVRRDLPSEQGGDKAVAYADARSPEGGGVDESGHSQEDAGRGHNDLSSVALEMVALHPFFDGKRLKFVVELLYAAHRNGFGELGHEVELADFVNASSAANHLNGGVLFAQPPEGLVEQAQFCLVLAAARHSHRANLKGMNEELLPVVAKANVGAAPAYVGKKSVAFVIVRVLRKVAHAREGGFLPAGDNLHADAALKADTPGNFRAVERVAQTGRGAGPIGRGVIAVHDLAILQERLCQLPLLLRADHPLGIDVKPQAQGRANEVIQLVAHLRNVAARHAFRFFDEQSAGVAADINGCDVFHGSG